MTSRRHQISGAGLPEVPEADAPGDIAAVYADIRAVTHEPAVSLVYRHLATVPGALEWAWATLRPLFQDGGIAAAAREAARPAVTLQPDPIDPAALEREGIGAEQLERIERILAFYARSNPRNYVAVATLTTLLAGELPAPSVMKPDFLENPAPQRDVQTYLLPEPLRPGEMTPEVRNLVRHLSGLLLEPSARMIPTVLRHLAHWPPFLQQARAVLFPLIHDGRLSQAADAMAAWGRIEARRLADAATPARPPPDFHAEARHAVQGRLGGFLTDIPRVTAAVLALRTALAGGTDSDA